MKLVPPVGAEVALEVVEGAQLGIAVRRQHLPVRVDVHALALGLLQELVQGAEVVPADEDCGIASSVGRGDFCGAGGPQGGAVGLVQHLHHLEVQRSDSQALPKRRVQGLPSVGGGAGARDRQVAADAEELAVDLRALLLGVGRRAHPEVLRVIEVGGGAFETVGAHLDDAEEVLVAHQLRPGEQARRSRSEEQFRLVAGQRRGQAGESRRHRRLALALLQEALHGLGEVGRLRQVAPEAAVVEVHVRERREGGLEHDLAHVRCEGAGGPRGVGQLAEAKVVQHLEVLEPGQLRGLGAHAHGRAALAAAGLLALVAHHLRRGHRRGDGGHPLQHGTCKPR
mmetsp:Transcript_73207/g.214592  ORF Transcript_73207/g.214592 Transcript_73207/m.214592 type:complete len:340 (+) Transcript_73207:892-1911(+)